MTERRWPYFAAIGAIDCDRIMHIKAAQCLARSRIEASELCMEQAYKEWPLDHGWSDHVIQVFPLAVQFYYSAEQYMEDHDGQWPYEVRQE